MLDLAEDVDLAGLKQRWRTLARDLHPDRGGDPQAFLDLRDAYEVLRASLVDAAETAPVVTVARGRPSRTDDAAGQARRLDEQPLGAAAQALARRLAVTGTARAVSRAPGSRLNGVAASFALGTASTLEARLTSRPALEGRCGAHIRLTVRSRGARRALAALDLPSIDGAAWARHRGDGVTALESQVTAEGVEGAARRAAAATVGMLAALRWPLEAWREV